MVRRARPQQHQSNGGAERAVRRLKESLAVLRAEMNQGGADVCFTEKGLSDVVTYIALSHNHFSKAHGTDFSPLEYSTQRKLSRPSFAMFGQSVLAELPSSMRAQSPNETRSIEASFAHSGLDTGPIVQGAVRIDGELVLKRFVARNVKAITPIAWNQTIGDQLFVALDGGQGPGEPLPVQPGVHVEPAAPDVQRPELPDSNVMQPIPEADIVEYPDGAPDDLDRDMKEADPSFRAPLQRKRQVESTSSQTRKPGELKILLDRTQVVHWFQRDHLCLECLRLRLPRVQDPRCRVAEQLDKETTIEAQNDILSAIIGTRSPNTTLKRVNALLAFYRWMVVNTEETFSPLSEAAAWAYVRNLSSTQAAPTRATSKIKYY